MSTSLQTLIQEAADHIGLLGGPVAPSSGTSSTVFIMAGAASHFDERDENTLMEDVWAKCETDSAVTPQNVGEVRRIKSYAASTQTITLPTSRGFSNTPTTTQTYGFYWAVPPGNQWRNITGWKYYINRVLTSLRYSRLGLLTLITDGDMETSGTSNWTASNATLTKVTTASTVGAGSQSLHVVNTSANGYARSALVNVAPGDLYFIRATKQVVTGTAVIEAYDETNSASITSQSSTQRDWRYLYYTFSVPSGCRQLSIRLKGTESNADIYWENVSLLSTGTRRINIPTWVDKENAVRGFYQSKGFYSQTFDVADLSTILIPIPVQRVVWDAGAANPMWVELSRAPSADSILLVEGLSRYSSLTNDTDTTFADEDLIVHGACYLALVDLGRDKDAQLELAQFTGKARATLQRMSKPLTP